MKLRCTEQPGIHSELAHCRDQVMDNIRVFQTCVTIRLTEFPELPFGSLRTRFYFSGTVKQVSCLMPGLLSCRMNRQLEILKLRRMVQGA